MVLGNYRFLFNQNSHFDYDIYMLNIDAITLQYTYSIKKLQTDSFGLLKKTTILIEINH